MTKQIPIGSGFGAVSSTMDVIAGINLHGKNAIVTGSYSGLGLETVHALSSAGATELYQHVILNVLRKFWRASGMLKLNRWICLILNPSMLLQINFLPLAALKEQVLFRFIFDGIVQLWY